MALSSSFTTDNARRSGRSVGMIILMVIWIWYKITVVVLSNEAFVLAREEIAVAANAFIDIAGTNYFSRHC